MAVSGVSARRGSVFLAVVVTAGLVGFGVRPAVAQVTAVKGSAYGFFFDATFFNNPVTEGPAPTVTLPAGGSAAPVTATAPSVVAEFGPAVLFSAGQVDVSTAGATGADGTATASASLQGINAPGGEVFTADAVASTCTATEAGVSGSTTITNGTVETLDSDPPVVVPVPTNPPANTRITGEIIGDDFEYVFNEQITNPDGSLTVYAAHLRLFGPNAIGDIFIGKSECGVTTGTPPTTSGSSTSSSAPTSSTTTTAPNGTTTTSAPPPPATTTTTAGDGGGGGGVSAISGGAYGFFTSVGLFGGPPATRGPEPSVELPAGGSATPITASAPQGEAVYGPATIFSAGAMDVSTQGTTGADGSVTSSATVRNANRLGDEQVRASEIASTCTASGTGETGSATFTDGSLLLSLGPNIDDPADDRIVPIPANPAPNTSFEGTREDVGDTFRIVVNEHQTSAGSITVNAVHMYLLGPSAKGDLIIGQVRCSTNATGGTPGGGGGGGGGSTAGRRTTARTGSEIARLAQVALALMITGSSATVWSRRRETEADRVHGLS